MGAGRQAGRAALVYGSEADGPGLCAPGSCMILSWPAKARSPRRYPLAPGGAAGPPQPSELWDLWADALGLQLV